MGQDGGLAPGYRTSEDLPRVGHGSDRSRAKHSVALICREMRGGVRSMELCYEFVCLKFNDHLARSRSPRHRQSQELLLLCLCLRQKKAPIDSVLYDPSVCERGQLRQST